MSGNRSQSLTLVFAHGWVMGDWFWEPLLTHFPDHEIKFLSRTYRVDDPINEPAFTETGWVGIGHSLGFRRLLDCQNTNCRGLVSICGFYDFVAAPGTDTRIVRAMLRRFRSSPKSVLEKFIENCGLSNSSEAAKETIAKSDWNWELLQFDLEALLTGWQRQNGQDPQQIDVPILSLAASLDKIVPSTLTRCEFDNSIFHPAAGHGLGFKYSDWCATQTKEFLKTL